MNYAKGNGLNNLTKEVKVMVATEDNSPVFLLNDRKLCKEGRVKFRLANKFDDEIYTFINTISENKYEIYLKLEYLDHISSSIGNDYTEINDRVSLQNNYLVNEITRQISQIFSKDIVIKDDFLNLECEAYIVTDVNNEGIVYSKFTNINVYKNYYKECLSEGEDVFKKSYSELNESDTQMIANELNLNPESTMYKDKMIEIESFCKKEEDIEAFLYKGKTFMRLAADLAVDINGNDEKVHEYAMETIKQFDIKPGCIFIEAGYCCLEYMPKEYFHFRHWSDYLKLKIDFIEFLESINIKGVKLIYNRDAGSELREIDEKLPVLSNVKFTKKLFEHKQIELYGRYAYFIDIEDIENYKEYDGSIVINTVILEG